ncbi:MAG: hypothetical protein ACRDEA_16780 [Microcystaceae cyanobacterium]
MNWDLTKAHCRAGAYHAAGADAILIHSKRSRPEERDLLDWPLDWLVHDGGNKATIQNHSQAYKANFLNA